MVKQGLDDFFARGHNVDDLMALAESWNGRGPGIAWLDEQGTGDARIDALQSRIVQLEMELVQVRADNTALVELINHPVLTHAQIKIAVQTAILPRAKASHGDVDANGDVVISAAEQSNDWRPKPAKQEDGVTPRLAPMNQDGTVPRLARSNVRPIMEWAIEHELVPAKAIPVQRSHTSGAAWKDTAWSITPAKSLADALNPWLNYQANAPKQRKTRTVPEACPHCHEVHDITRRDYCGSVDDPGCGAQIGPDKVIKPIKETGDNLSPVRESPPSRPHYELGDNLSPVFPEEPTWLANAPDPASDEVSEADRSCDDDDGVDVSFYAAQDALTGEVLAAPDDAQRVLHREPRQEVFAPPTGTAGDDRWTWA